MNTFPIFQSLLCVRIYATVLYCSSLGVLPTHDESKFHDLFSSLKLYFPQLQNEIWHAQGSFPTGSFLPKLPGTLIFFKFKDPSRRKNYPILEQKASSLCV